MTKQLDKDKGGNKLLSDDSSREQCEAAAPANSTFGCQLFLQEQQVLEPNFPISQRHQSSPFWIPIFSWDAVLKSHWISCLMQTEHQGNRIFRTRHPPPATSAHQAPCVMRADSKPIKRFNQLLYWHEFPPLYLNFLKTELTVCFRRYVSKIKAIHFIEFNSVKLSVHVTPAIM